MGAARAALGDATVLTWDDVARSGRPAATASVISRDPLRLPCDEADHDVPAGASGTWLRLSADSGARIWTAPGLAPAPARGVMVLTQQATFGSPSVKLSCSGAREVVIQSVLDAPPP